MPRAAFHHYCTELRFVASQFEQMIRIAGAASAPFFWSSFDELNLMNSTSTPRTVSSWFCVSLGYVAPFLKPQEDFLGLMA
jgi:hypothetical protein